MKTTHKTLVPAQAQQAQPMRRAFATLLLAFALIAAFVAAPTASYSQASAQASTQAAGKKEANIDKRLEMLKKHLLLTDEQMSKVRPLVEAHHADMEKIRTDNKGNKDSLKTVAKTRHEAFEKDMAAVLTPEQNKKWLAGREKMRDRIEERMEKRKAGK